MESIMMDQSSMNSRRGANSVLAGKAGGNYSGFSTTMRSGDAPNSHASMSSLSHLLLDHSYGGYESARPPLPVYSSLPPSFASLHALLSPPPPPAPLIPHVQPAPPLLPLPAPFSRSATLPVPTSNAAGVAGPRPSYQRRKQKAKKKETMQPWVPVASGFQAKDEAKKPLQKPSSASSEEYELEGEQEMESVYSLSPPPSSLPMPSYALVKPRDTTSAACTAQAIV